MDQNYSHHCAICLKPIYYQDYPETIEVMIKGKIKRVHKECNK